MHTLCATAILCGCGGTSPTPPTMAAAPTPAVLQAGDVTIRASAVPTHALGEAVAQQYGIERDPRTVLLLVGVRRGSGTAETSLPARVRGSAVDLLGRRQEIAMREIRSDGPASGSGQGFIDYAGTVRISPPETLRFDLAIERDGAAPATLVFSRDFFP